MRPSLLYFLLGLSLLGTKLAYDHGQRQAGVWQERARVADSTAQTLRASIRQGDVVYVRDTIRMVQRVTRWRDSVVARVDTLADTVRVPVEVVRWVVAEADSTIQACRSVVQTCERRVAQRDSLNALLSQRLKIEQARRPAGWKRWAERAAWAGLVIIAAK